MTALLSEVKGVCPVLSAAFDDDGSVDSASFTRMCEHVMGTGVGSLMVFGVATENAKLSDDERTEMLQLLVQARGTRNISLVATVADHGTDLAVARARKWVDMGADSINILPSYFLRPAPSEVIDHLSAILQSVTVPVIIQSLPAGGEEIPLSDVLSLHHSYPHLQQVKVENIPASALVAEVAGFSGGSVSALVGWGGLEWKKAVAAGAVGVQPGCSLTELYLKAQACLDSKDMGGFDTAFAPLQGPLNTWMRHPEVLIAIEKHILMRRGIISSSRTRKPSAPLTNEDFELAEVLIELVGAGKEFLRSST